MLKNSYLEPYQKNKIKMSEFEKYMLKHDENHMVDLQRPMSNKCIKKFPDDILQTFTEDIMCNKDINNLLYSVNAKKELCLYLKQENHIIKITTPQIKENSEKKKKKKPKKQNENSNEEEANSSTNENIDVSLQKILINKRKEELEDIKNNIAKSKYNKMQKMKKLKIKNNKFMRSQPKIDEKLTKLYFLPVNEIRLKEYKKVFNKCLNKSLENKKFKMPDIALKLNNVYSRLYHDVLEKSRKNNSVKSNNKLKKEYDLENNNNNINNEKNEKNKIDTTKTSKSRINQSNSKIFTLAKKEKEYNVRNIFKNFYGREFVHKITTRMQKKSWKRLSGGPSSAGKKIIRRRNRFKSAKLTVENCFLNDSINKKESEKLKNSESILLKGMILANTKPKHEIVNLKKIRDLDYNTNLHIAVMNNSYKFVDYFIKNKINVNKKNKRGRTPLHMAINSGNNEIIKLLLDSGADINIKDKEGISPFDLAPKDVRKTFMMEK